MTDQPTDPKMAFVLMVKDHLACEPIKNLSRILASDQAVSFWSAPFSKSYGRWDKPGGLAESMMVGYQAFRILVRSAEALFTSVNEDRLLAIYLTLMSSRWANLRDLSITFAVDQPASVTSTAVANAITIGLDLTPIESQALVGWHFSRAEMQKNYEKFTPEWWVISESMWWLFTANRK